MMLIRQTFQSVRRSRKVRFTCVNCGATNRSRTITVEHTVNPFNKNENGTVRTPAQVAENVTRQLARDVLKFSAEPWCARCENDLPWAASRALAHRRSASAAA